MNRLTKIAIGTLIFAWLVKSEKIGLEAITNIFQNPSQLFVLLCLWSFGPILIYACRWQEILQLFELKIRFKKLLQTHLIAQFFNGVIPGAFGGDMIKIHYLIKGPKKIQIAMKTIILDRLIGLLGLNPHNAEYEKNSEEVNVFFRYSLW